jgi:NTP pyrophosphatase (non-canonical NTP hydrolase)
MMQTIFNLIAEERKRQDIKWGANRDQHDMIWLTILIEEVGETAEAILKHLPTVKDELIQVAAVAVAWLENIESRNHKEQTHD